MFKFASSFALLGCSIPKRTYNSTTRAEFNKLTSYSYSSLLYSSRPYSTHYAVAKSYEIIEKSLKALTALYLECLYYLSGGGYSGDVLSLCKLFATKMYIYYVDGELNDKTIISTKRSIVCCDL